MLSANFRNVSFLLFRFLSSIAVLYLLIAPLAIHRQTSSSASLSFVFHGGHHFCRRPEARAINVSHRQIFEALNLPDKSTIQLDDHVIKFGECRAKVKKVHQDETLCNCDPPFRLEKFYRVQLIHSTISLMIVAMVIFCSYPWECGKKFVPVLLFDCTACCVLIFNFVYDFSNLHNLPQNHDYFVGDPIRWTVALCISLATLVFSLLLFVYGVLECVCRKKKQERRDRMWENLKATVCSSSIPVEEEGKLKKHETHVRMKPDIEMAVEDFMIVRQLVKRVPKFRRICSKTYP